jgi:hypothetical protein
VIKTLEAVIDDQGNVRLLEPVQFESSHRAIVLILDEPEAPVDETAVLSEAALQDWNRPEEDAAWSHLQPAK